jgi:hypothetical protein
LRQGSGVLWHIEQAIAHEQNNNDRTAWASTCGNAIDSRMAAPGDKKRARAGDIVKGLCEALQLLKGDAKLEHEDHDPEDGGKSDVAQRTSIAYNKYSKYSKYSEYSGVLYLLYLLQLRGRRSPIVSIVIIVVYYIYYTYYSSEDDDRLRMNREEAATHRAERSRAEWDGGGEQVWSDVAREGSKVW